MTETAVPVLALEHLSKTFPGVQALDDVSFDVRRGEIHCLVGENGAGKSTLIKILSGVYPADSFDGRIAIDGEPRRWKTAADAAARGIAAIYQELSLLPELTVAENVYLGRQPTLPGLPAIDWDRLDAQAAELLAGLDMAVSPTARVADLSVSERQQVEIAKAISRHARILILDEPTSALPDSEVTRLYETLAALRRQGVAIVYITHRLDEVFALADRVSVLRDGRLIATRPIGEMTRRDLVALMVGHDVEEHPDHASLAAGETALSVQNLTVRDSGQGRPLVDDVSFDVAHGELLVLTGLIGAGCSEVLRAIWGGLPGRTAGEIRIDGLPVRIANPRQAMAHGLGYVPGDRKEEGLILSMSAAHNLTLAVLRRLSRWLAIDEGREAGIVDRLFGRLRVRAAHPGVIVGTLSGGNQQKIAIGKWLATSPEVLLLDQPTRGIDIGARAEIYALLRELAEQGMAVVVAAADLTEALGLGDRIIVMGGGRIAGELARGEATQDRIIALASEEPARAGEE